jgi:AcrR family transcriptional regulator
MIRSIPDIRGHTVLAGAPDHHRDEPVMFARAVRRWRKSYYGDARAECCGCGRSRLRIARDPHRNGRVADVVFGYETSGCDQGETRGNDERFARTRKCGTERLDRAALDRAVFRKPGEVVIERRVDDGIGGGGAALEAREIFEAPSVDGDAFGGEVRCCRVGSRKAGDSVSARLEFLDDRRPDPTGRPGNKDVHAINAFLMTVYDMEQHSIHVSSCHHDMIERMSRWSPNARGRLQQAAYELFLDRGYEQTTVADIAKRAGLTERTFFRHYADKREVLFGGSAHLHEELLRALDDASLDLPTIEVVRIAAEALSRFADGRRTLSRERQRIIDAHADLQERELIKRAALTAALARGLKKRGVPEAEASLAADVGIAVFFIGFALWLEDPQQRELVDVVREGFDRLKAVASGT